MRTRNVKAREWMIYDNDQISVLIAAAQIMYGEPIENQKVLATFGLNTPSGPHELTLSPVTGDGYTVLDLVYYFDGRHARLHQTAELADNPYGKDEPEHRNAWATGWHDADALIAYQLITHQTMDMEEQNDTPDKDG